MNIHHRWADVINAWADGKIIQRKPIGEDFTWIDQVVDEYVPDFNSKYLEWRIKPTQE